MPKIEMPVEKLAQFIQLVSCEGASEDGKSIGKAISQIVIDALPGEIQTLATDKFTKVFVNIKMKANTLEQGQICIDDISDLARKLDAFESKDSIIISQKDGLVIMEKTTQPNPKKVTVRAIALENIETQKSSQFLNSRWKLNDAKTEFYTEKVKLNCMFTVKADSLHSLIKDREIVGESYYPFTVFKEDSGNLVLRITIGSLQSNNCMIESVIPAVITNGVELKNKYAYGFDNVFNHLTGDVKLYTGQNMPLWVLKESPEYTAIYMVAPVVD